MKKRGIFALYLVFSFAIFFGFVSNISFVDAANQTNMTGSLYVQTNPTGANVYVDGINWELSPITLNNLAVGEHIVRVTKSGYLEASTNPLIQADQTTSIYLTLQQLTQQGSIYVTTSPTSASIYLDGIIKGISPLYMWNVTIGNHVILATKPSYQDASQTVNVVDGHQTTASLVLQPINQNQSVGSLSVSTNPIDSAIYLDGIFKGTTQYGTLYVYNIPIGTHTVKATKYDYQDVTQKVNIQTSTMTNITMNLIKYTYSCSDTDNGNNYLVKGTAKLVRSDGNITQSVTDFCNTQKSLTEYYCAQSGGTISVAMYECKTKCKNGACQSPSAIPLANNSWALIGVLVIVIVLSFMWKKKNKALKTKPTKKKRL